MTADVERERILVAIADAEAMVARWERGGGPRQIEYAAKAREHVRCWRFRLAELDVALIPDDGQVHTCACGDGAYRVWDCDGYAPPVVIDDNSDGERAGDCDECGRSIAVAPRAAA